MEISRKTRVEALISKAPESVKITLRGAFSGSASPRAAIKAQCLVCVGYDRAAIRDCTGYSCPLWEYRPFQKEAEPAAAPHEQPLTKEA